MKARLTSSADKNIYGGFMEYDIFLLRVVIAVACFLLLVFVDFLVGGSW